MLAVAGLAGLLVPQGSPRYAGWRGAVVETDGVDVEVKGSGQSGCV